MFPNLSTFYVNDDDLDYLLFVEYKDIAEFIQKYEAMVQQYGSKLHYINHGSLPKCDDLEEAYKQIYLGLNALKYLKSFIILLKAWA